MPLPPLSSLPTFPMLEITLPASHHPSPTHLLIPQTLPQLAHAISKWKKIFPKINNKAPKDVQWIPRDIDNEDHTWEKLFSSDRIQWKERGNVLCVRKYFDINPGMEFRFFVKQRRLVGISQRDIAGYYPYLASLTEEIRKAIRNFKESILDAHESCIDYSVDVYISGQRRITVCGIDEWGEASPLLFTWQELDALEECELRLSEGGIASAEDQISYDGEDIALDTLIKQYESTQDHLSSDTEEEDR